MLSVSCRMRRTYPVLIDTIKTFLGQKTYTHNFMSFYYHYSSLQYSLTIYISFSIFILIEYIFFATLLLNPNLQNVICSSIVNPISHGVKSLVRLTGYATGMIKMSSLIKRLMSSLRQALGNLKQYHRICKNKFS